MLCPEYRPPLSPQLCLLAVAHTADALARRVLILLTYVHRCLDQHQAARLAEEVVVPPPYRHVVEGVDEGLVCPCFVVRRVQVLSLLAHG